jgi:ligand-binding SRPBCC domain-containing protein
MSDSGYLLTCELVAPVSVEQAFAVFENPYNLSRVTPPWLNFKIAAEGLTMRRGVEIEYRLRWLGLPLAWKTVISEYDPPRLFVDEALRSPYRYWRHRHTFAVVPGGTLVADHVAYALPLGALGRAAHAMVVSRQLMGIFRFRQAAIGEMLGGMTSVREPSIRRAEGRQAS